MNFFRFIVFSLTTTGIHCSGSLDSVIETSCSVVPVSLLLRDNCGDDDNKKRDFLCHKRQEVEGNE